MAEKTRKKPGLPKGVTNAGSFQPGTSGNPGGRPVTKPWSEALNAIAKEKATEGLGTKLEQLARVTFAKALNGDADAREEIGNRLEGKVAQSVTHEGNPQQPIEGKIVFEHTFKSGI